MQHSDGLNLPYADEDDTGPVTQPKPSQTLVYDDNNLISGTLDGLIQHLSPTEQYYPNRSYVFAFLLCSRLLIRPSKLLKEVFQVCVNHEKRQLQQCNDARTCLWSNVLRLLAEWANQFPYDFRDGKLMKQFRDVTEWAVRVDPALDVAVAQVVSTLVDKLTTLDKYEQVLERIHHEVSSQERPSSSAFSETCLSPLETAKQLTLIELDRLKIIGPEEFVQSFHQQRSLSGASEASDAKKTCNLEAYVEWFNRLSYFTATEICKHAKRKTRVKMIEYFIDVAKECFNSGNFNSLMAIIAGLNLSPIARLKKSWSKVDTRKFEILEHQMNPTNNFSSYRASMKAALWRSQSAQNQCEKVIIPFFSLLVKDIYFINEGSSNKLSNGHVNVEKFWQLSKQIEDFVSWKKVDCPFERNGKVLTHLLTSLVFSEESLMLASFHCEAPDNHFEKEQYKSLKLRAMIDGSK